MIIFCDYLYLPCLLLPPEKKKIKGNSFLLRVCIVVFAGVFGNGGAVSDTNVVSDASGAVITFTDAGGCSDAVDAAALRATMVPTSSTASVTAAVSPGPSSVPVVVNAAIIAIADINSVSRGDVNAAMELLLELLLLFYTPFALVDAAVIAVAYATFITVTNVTATASPLPPFRASE